ncbi:MAG: ribonuclease III, partial [Candidatus Nomurabacteria bacterium]|nr:ribonuclease III [Candidatus Nomurabacteria bacterium]
MEPQFKKFEKKLGFTFNDSQLLMQAFTHRSYINENPGVAWHHNERLEFLGDAVLELVTTKHLFEKYPKRPEGELTAFRAALVNTQSISAAAKEWGMNDFLLLSKGEAKDENTKARDYILANTFEAVIGSIYLDQGYDVAGDFIEKSLFGKLDEIVEQSLWRDAKSWVQEESQEHMGVTPTYKVLSAQGPDHDKDFVIGIYFD